MEPTFPQKSKRRRKRRKTDCWLWNIPTFLTLIKADLKILKISQGKKWLNYYVNMKKRTHFPQRIHKLSKNNWAKLIYVSLILREQEEKKPQIFCIADEFWKSFISFHRAKSCAMLHILKNLWYFEESKIFWKIFDNFLVKNPFLNLL